MSKTTIIVCAHKEAPLPGHPFFLPVQAGAALHPHIEGYQPDDAGDNISERNPHFCELTCHYWAWKNLREADIVGLNHYRRFFDFSCRHPRFAADKRFTEAAAFLAEPYRFPDLGEWLSRCDIILPTERHWRVSNTRQYADYHIARDWETLRSIIRELTPEYLPSFRETMDCSNHYSGYNMFITRYDLFCQYSEWLFRVLFEVERRVPPAADPVQGRIYGYMSERLINVFCHRHGLRVRHVPLVMPLDNCPPDLNASPLRATLRRLGNDLRFRLGRG